MAALSINDAGTWRTPNVIYVNDAGTWRTIQQIYVNDAGTWRTVFQYLLLDAVMTEGASGFGEVGFYDSSIGASQIGSMSSVSVGGLYTLAGLYGDPTVGVLAIRGFSSNPGQSYFSSVVVNGVTTTSASADSYTYGFAGPNTARWVWNGMNSLWGLDGSGTSTVVINSP